MSDIKTKALITVKVLGERYPSGLVTLYMLPAALESIVLRIAASNGGEPIEGEKYIVEFIDADTGSVIEVLEEDETQRLDMHSIRNFMDDLAETYLLSIASDRENYVQQSGRCSPKDGGPSVFKRSDVEQFVIRG